MACETLVGGASPRSRRTPRCHCRNPIVTSRHQAPPGLSQCAEPSLPSFECDTCLSILHAFERSIAVFWRQSFVSTLSSPARHDLPRAGGLRSRHLARAWLGLFPFLGASYQVICVTRSSTHASCSLVVSTPSRFRTTRANLRSVLR